MNTGTLLELPDENAAGDAYDWDAIRQETNELIRFDWFPIEIRQATVPTTRNLQRNPTEQWIEDARKMESHVFWPNWGMKFQYLWQFRYLCFPHPHFPCQNVLRPNPHFFS